MTRYSWPCRVIRVLDGDTLEVEIDRGFHDYSRKTVRLLGVNAPETHGAEREAGEAVRNWLLAWLDRSDAFLTSFPLQLLSLDKPDKFGRVLGDISTGSSIVAQLLTFGYAKPYDGGKRDPFTPEECAAIVAKLRPEERQNDPANGGGTDR